MKKALFISLLSVFFYTEVFSQDTQYPQFSIATDLGVQRSFKKEQRYWALGQTVDVIFHLTPKNSVYVWFAYYSNGKFNNNVVATAKLPVAAPQQIPYTNSAKMRLKHFSVGWRRYLKGDPLAESNWNLYGYAGLGLLAGRIINTHSVSIDTANYNVPVLSGTGNFKRLTLDLGLGWELPLNASFSLYAEGRVWVPTTDYPSNYLFVNNSAPLVGMANVGLRILFD